MSGLFGAHVSFSIDCEFDAPVQRVWDAWTRPELFSQWVWAGMGTEPSAVIDLRVGGVYTASMVSKQVDGWRSTTFTQGGVYVHIEPRRKLIYTLHWDAPVGYNQQQQPVLDEAIAVEFEAQGERTRVRFSHHGIPDDGVSAPEHERGERQMLKCLEQVLLG